MADLKLNVNSTGGKSIKINSAGTLSNLGDKSYLKAASYPFIYNGTYWVLVSYDTNTNTIGYTIRTNGLQIPVKTACYRYRICFTSPDGNYLIPANASTSTSATASKTVTTEKIDPFGRIIYYSYTTALAAGDSIGTSYQMQQYNGVTLGYSFNRTGAALTMTAKKPVYVKCAPQTDGSAIIDASTPFVQDLPTTADGKIYIFLGVATSATAIEFTLEHPVYEYKGGCVRQYTNAYIPSIPVTDVTLDGTSVLDGTVAKLTTPTVHEVPSGGSTGQVLAKNSNTDYDLTWATAGGGGTVTDVTVDGTSVLDGTVGKVVLTGKADAVHTHVKTDITDFPTIPTNTSDLNNDSGFITSSSVPSASSTSPKMDGTAAVGSETTWAKGDHVHPSDTSKQDTLVSGTNIKTINNSSLLGSGNISLVTNVINGTGTASIELNTLDSASGDYATALGFGTIASGVNSLANGQYTTAQRKSQVAIGEYNELDTTGADGTVKGDYVFIVGNGTNTSNRSNAFTVDWNGNVAVSGDVVATSSKKILAYTGECITLRGNQTASEAAGQISLTGTSKNCLPNNKYDTVQSPLAGDLFSVSAGVITLLKAGRYRVDYQAYFYNGFTANDALIVSVQYSDTGANARATRWKTPYTNPYYSLGGSCSINASANATLKLTAHNETASRGIVGVSGYTRIFVECLAVYE